MTSWASSPATRRSMQGNRGRDTAPEIAVRKALHAAGLRFRVDFKVPGAPRRRCDIAFTRAKVAVFIDGCFWHRCADHYSAPKTHNQFWDKKTSATALRDVQTTSLLEESGWLVLRYWEHEAVQDVAARITATVRGRVSAS